MAECVNCTRHSEMIDNGTLSQRVSPVDINDTEVFEGTDMVGIVPKILYICVIYALVILGVIGNILVFAIMQHAWFRHMSYSVYLRSLAVCDTLYLLMNCAEDILDHQFNLMVQFDGIGLHFCIPWSFTKNCSRYASPWLIVALTLDRFIAVVVPLKRSIFCSLKTARITSVGIIAYSMVENIIESAHERMEFSPKGEPYCIATGGPVFETYYSIKLLFFQSTLPCFFILILNIFTIIAIKRSHKFRRSFKDNDGTSKQQTADKVTASLIAVSLMAFCTLVPQAILEVIERFFMIQFETYEVEMKRRNITEIVEPAHLVSVGETWPLLNLVAMVNFCQNFYILIISGPRYRQALLSCITRTRSGHHANGMDSSSQASRTKQSTVWASSEEKT